MNELDHATKSAVTHLAAQIGEPLRNELAQQIEVFKKTMETAVSSLGEARENIESAADGLFEKLDERIATLEKSSDNVAHSLNEKTAQFGKDIADWVGFLSATSHAHSKELDALSAEMSELFNNLKVKLLSSVEEQINIKDNEIKNEIKDAKLAIEKLSAQIAANAKIAPKNFYVMACFGVLGLLLIIKILFLL